MAGRGKKSRRRRRRRQHNPGVGAWVGSFLLTGLAMTASNMIVPNSSLALSVGGLALVGSDTIKVEDKSVRSGILWSMGLGVGVPILLGGVLAAVSYGASK